jgi:hypothetical protein
LSYLGEMLFSVTAVEQLILQRIARCKLMVWQGVSSGMSQTNVPAREYLQNNLALIFSAISLTALSSIWEADTTLGAQDT